MNLKETLSTIGRLENQKAIFEYQKRLVEKLEAQLKQAKHAMWLAKEEASILQELVNSSDQRMGIFLHESTIGKGKIICTTEYCYEKEAREKLVQLGLATVVCESGEHVRLVATESGRAELAKNLATGKWSWESEGKSP